MQFIASASGQQSGLVWLAILGVAALIGGILYGLAWWEQRKGGGKGHSIATQAGGAMLELQSLLEPGKRHVIEAKKQVRKEEESGDDDDTSGREER